MSNVPRINRVRNAIQYDGKVMTPDTTEITMVFGDARGVLFAYGATKPSDAEAGYAKGCIFIDTDAAAGSVVYLNEGSETSCDFNTASLPTGDIAGVTAGAGLTGGGTSGTVTLDVNVDDSTIEINTDTVRLKDAGIVTAKIADAAVTPAKTNIVEARTATDDGTTTGTISANKRHITVTSAGAAKQIILPAPVAGNQLVIDVGANGFDLKSSTPASIAINGGTGASAKSAIPANSTVFLTCVSSTAWKGYYMDADGDVAKVPAAA